MLILYSSDIIRMIWEIHVERIGGKRDAYRILVEKPEEKNHFSDLGVSGRKH
jgi:hypothetical protein